MSEINITIDGGTSKRLLTAGKYCDRDIVVTAEGGGTVSIIETENPTTNTLQELMNPVYRPIVCPNVKEISEGAFNGNSYLENITFPIATIIERNAFSNCRALTSVKVPLASSIKNSAFSGCTSLTSIELPVASGIGDNAFINCLALTSVELPAAVIIRQYAFTNCRALTSVKVPLASNIGDYAFSECTSLTSIDLPVATKIGGNAFKDCINLTDFIFRTTETVCVADTSAFDNTPIMTGQGHIYVPTVMYEYYRAGYEPVLNQMMPGFFDIVFRRLEDYTVDGTITGDLDPDKI